MKLFGWLFALLIIIVGTVFAALNAKSVEVNYFFGSKTFPLVVLLFISLVIGILLCAMILGFRVIHLKARNRSLTRKLKRTEEELAQCQH